jgi:hypothetical protein
MCIYMAVVLQIFVVCERVLHQMLALVLMPKMSPLKAFSSRGVLAALFASISEIIGVAIGVFLTLGNVLLRNIGQIAALTLLAAGIIVLTGDGNDLLALFVNTYNSGIGVLLNVAIVQSLRFVYLIGTPFIVLYNGITWFSGQLVVQVVLPMLQVNVNALPDLMEGIMKTSAALALSFTTLMQRLIECSAMPGTLSETANAQPSNYTVPFTDASMNCVANDNYLMLDLMTPGAFFRQAAEAVFLVLSGSCSALTPILEVVWYPLSDYNFYWSLHNMVNFVLELLVLPLKTWRMCVYGSDAARGYTALEKSVMCTPDFVHANGLLTRTFMGLGKMLDNWLDVALHVAETQTLGVALDTVKCSQPAPISEMRNDVTALASFDLLNTNTAENSEVAARKTMRVVGLDGFLVLTDGSSSVLFDGQQQLSAVEHWPVEIDAALGVAAVHFYGDDERTAMFGCACRDEAAGMQLLCASTPLISDELNRTVHAVIFDASDMTCESVDITIQALRFPRSRYSLAVTGGTDIAQTERVFEDAQEITDVADAIIMIKPRCSLAGETRMACVPGARNCFPYCMGVHVAGRRNHIIYLENARVWRENVQYRETDCAVTTSGMNTCETATESATGDTNAIESNDLKVTGPDTFAGESVLFSYTTACVFDARECVEEPQATTTVPTSSVDRNIYNAPVVLLEEQPVVVAGDVMLFKQEQGLVVSRLRNTARGMRQERLTSSENKKIVLYKTCDEADADYDEQQSCASAALQEGKVLLPFRVQIDNAPRPAVASRWAVHWAVNAELSVLESLFAQCKGSASTGFIALSSVRRPRVWSLKTTRASYAMGLIQEDDPEEDKGVSYFVLPNAVNDGTACHAMVNMEVDDMEFIDDSNILITTKVSSPAQWPARFTYEYYYLHPNRHDCFGEEGDEPVFSCWRRVSEGPFVTDTGQDPLMAGQLCPALQRMPKLGSAGGHLYSASAHMLRLVVQLGVIIPALIAANGNVAEIFDTRLKVTYHSVLDSSGNELLDFDSILIHMDRSSMYTWQSLGVIANLFRGLPGHAVVEGVLVGTAKVKQFAWDQPAQFSDPLLRKLQQVTAAPTGKLLQAVQSIIVQNPFARFGIQMPAFIGTIQGMSMQVMSSMKLNVRLFRRYIKTMMKRLHPYRKYVDSFQFRLIGVDIVGKFFEDMRDEAPLSLTDMMRTQCDGFSTMLGFDNPMARVVRHACILIPLNIDALLEVASVMFSAYPTVSCVCKLSETDTNAWRTTCLERVNALTAQAWTKGIAIDLSTQQTQCFSAMDVANRRLETAFDLVFARMHLLTESLSPALDYLTVAWNVDAGQCVEQSGFVVSIMPDPVDYFMTCSGTFDCRARCLDNIVAFENALAMLTTIPQYEETQMLRVRSKFFSATAIDAGLHLPPFDIRAVYSATGSDSIDSLNSACGHEVVITGILEQQLVSQRYCVPRDVTAFVSAYSEPIVFSSVGQIVTEFTVQDMQFLSVTWEMPTQDKIVVLAARSIAGALIQKILICQEQFTQTLLQTSAWDPALYQHNALPGSEGFVLQGIERLRVISPKFIFVVGTRMVASSGDGLFDKTGLQYKEDFYLQTICLRIELSDKPEQEDATWVYCPQDIDPTNSSDHYEAHELIVPVHATTVCLDHACHDEIVLPRRRNGALFKRTVNYATDMHIDNVQQFRSSTALSSMLGLQLETPLYLTQNNAAAPNTRHLSPVAANSIGTDVYIIVTGKPSAAHSSAEVWLQMAVLGLDAENLNSAMLQSSEELSMEMDLIVDCSLDNCVGCQTNPPDEAYYNVQAKCLAAQQCALAKCVATPVNLARPLCNIGAAMTTSVDLVRVGLNGMWVALSRQIILIVELSESRRQEYEIDWPEEAFMSTMCASKDAIVESMATFTAVVGQSALTVDTALDTVQVRTAMSDSRWRARFFMGLEAMTRLLSSIAMLPMYAAIAAQRTVTCLQNDIVLIFQNAIGSDSIPKIRLGNKRVQERMARDSDAGTEVGACLSSVIADRMREVAIQPDFSSSEISTFVREIQDLKRRMPYESLSHYIDIFLSYAIGIVNGIMDVAQTLDFERCKLPDLSLQRIDQCVCGDNAMRIPDSQRRNSALWCTGPMLLTNSFGQDELIWNPYTFDELLGDEFRYEDFVQCLTASGTCPDNVMDKQWIQFLSVTLQNVKKLDEARSIVQSVYDSNKFDNAYDEKFDSLTAIKCWVGCDFLRPSSSKLREQGVENMQVITRCRGNYQAKQWDQGAALLGVYSFEEWQLFIAGSVVQKVSDSFDNSRAKFQALKPIIQQSGFPATNSNIDCLAARLGQIDAIYSCMFTTTTDLSAYFAYENALSSSTGSAGDLSYSSIDACESFTGDSMDATKRVSNASWPLFVWAGSSANSEPVASEHHKRGPDNNIEAAKDLLDKLVTDVKNDVETLLESEVEFDLQVDSYLVEGDVLHQLVDCLIIGPYAAADMRMEYFPNTLSSVMQYHRGDPTSREFLGGSALRKKIMQNVAQHVSASISDTTKQAALQKRNALISQWQNKDYLKCICLHNTIPSPSLECCAQYASVKDMRYYALQDTDFDLSDSIMDSILEEITNIDDSTLLSREIWQSEDFTPEPVEISENDKFRLRNDGVFYSYASVRSYDTDEVVNDQGLFSYTALWTHCMNLLDGGFFTMPMQTTQTNPTPNSASANIHNFNPARDSSESWLHAQESVIQKLLNESRHTVPVFWTHAHRYMPSDSVWCEDTTAAPGTVLTNKQLFGIQTETTIAGLNLLETQTILAPTLAKIEFPANTNMCVCGLSDSTSPKVCRVPNLARNIPNIDAELQAKWEIIYDNRFYDTRADLFTILEVMQASNDASVYADCQEPSITWGLLDKAQQYKWYANQMFTPQVNLQDIATHGPSGVRLQMLMDSVDSLAESMHNNVLSEPDTENSAYNFVHQHSIAQPFCESNKDQLFVSDLKSHFQDVLFPMAHTVHLSPVSAYCTSWAVEHAILMTLDRTLSQEHPALLQQIDIEKNTRKKCYIQLEQIGICQLRGVFEMPPIDQSVSCPQLTTLPTSLSSLSDTCACSWRLPNNLIACQNVVSKYVTFYDEAQCVGRTPCNADDMLLAFRPQDFATPDVQLRSLHWPSSIPRREAGQGTIQAMAERIARIIEHNNINGFDTEQLREIIDTQLIRHDSQQTEGEAPDAFCDDLLDWYPPDAQHPVGYHPTTTLDHATTHVRGFDSWMSGYTLVSGESEIEYDYVVDARMRNHSTESRFFGAGNLVCDARTYGRLLREPKTYYVETRWDATSAADPAVPGAASPEKKWGTLGVNTEQNPRHTPLLQAWQELHNTEFEEDYLLHSSGLVRNWLRFKTDHGEDTDTNIRWPNWQQNERVGEYGYVGDSQSIDPGCSEHPVQTCESDADCSAGLVCLLVPTEKNVENGEEEFTMQPQRGLCARHDTCFAHKHCIERDPKTLCSGEGKCLPAYILVKNEMGVAIDIQLFSKAGDVENTKLETGTAGFSEYQQIESFARDQGLCSLRNWQSRYNATKAKPDSTWSQILHFVDRDDEEIMQQQAHVCDRTWQHTAFAAHSLNDASLSSGKTLQDKKIAYTRSWRQDNTRVECDFVQLREYSAIISPYSYFNTTTRDYFYILDNVHSTVQRCANYNLCPVLQFQLAGGFTVPRRLSLGTMRSSSTLHITLLPGDSVAHDSRVKATCGAAGQQTNYGTCVLDQLVVPVAAVVYHMASLDPNTFSGMAPGQLLAPYLPALSPEDRDNLMDKTQKHCPHANADIWETMHTTLMREYQQSNRQVVALAASRLMPMLFGMDFDASNTMTNNLDNFWSIDLYLEHVQCAEWLFTMLSALQENMPNIYQTDPRLPQLRPGLSLYVFRDRAHVEMPFSWFWKCALLERYPNANWLKHITGGLGTVPVDTDSMQKTHVQSCAALEAQDMVTVRQQLQHANHFFKRDLIISAQAIDQLARDVDATLARGLDELGLREFPDLFYVELTNQCEDPLQHGLFPHKNEVDKKISCVVKYGRDLTQTLLTESEVEEIRTDPEANPLAETGLRAAARRHLFGFASHITLLSKTLSELHGFISENNDLDERQVSRDATFIPRLVFEQGIPESIEISPRYDQGSQKFVYTDETVLHDYTFTEELTQAGTHNPPRKFRLTQEEYQRYKPPAGHPVDNSDYPLYLREDQALQELLQWFFRDIYTTPTFRSENLFASDEFIPGAEQMTTRNEIDFSLAYRFNAQMQERLFECTSANEIDETAITSEIHGQLRACLRAMQHDLGLRLDNSDTVQIPVSANVMLDGFYPAFSENSVSEDLADSRGFLERLTSDSVASLAFDSFCFTDLRTQTYTVINPLWSGLFDLDSGCDLEKIGSGFNAFYRVRADIPQPKHCDLHRRIDFKGSGTILGSEVPLCDRVLDNTHICHRRTGTLAGNTGVSVTDLLEEHPIQYHHGLFSQSIFRRRTRFFPKVDSTTSALMYRLGEIGGHQISFKVNSAGQMIVDCVSISDDISMTCRDWLHDIEQFWAREHQQQRPTNTDQELQPWTCPLQLISSWSGRLAQYQPNIMRNRVRFASVTGDYDSVHPVISSRRPLTQLRPARFMSEMQMCLQNSADFLSLGPCQGLEQLQEAIKFVTSDVSYDSFDKFRTRLLYGTQTNGNRCSQILDWPHQNFTLRDGKFVPGDAGDAGDADADEMCWAQDRLPPFQIKLTRHNKQSSETLSSTNIGGPCHMGRLSRVEHVYTADPNDAEKSARFRGIQDCKRGDTLQCRVWDAENNVADTENFAWQSSTPIDPITRKQRKCSTAFTVQNQRGQNINSGVYNTGLDQTDSIKKIHSLENAPQQLSLGIPTQVRTARVIASHLRRILCASASSDSEHSLECETNLNKVVDVGSWNLDKFLAAFLSGARETSAAETDTTASSDSSVDAATDITDDILWIRPWVFCENSTYCAPNDGDTFSNFIPKSTWLDSNTRFTSCTEKMQAAPRTTQANVNFCLLTPKMTELCEKLKQWQSRHQQILCLAGGVDECPVSGFFYNPTTYSISNREFVYDTVDTFYQSIFGDYCSANTENDFITEQIAANQNSKNQCASSKIAPIKMILVGLRKIKGLVIEIVYYYGQILLQLLNMLLALVTSSAADAARVIQAAGDRLIMYIGMLFATIADLTMQIMRGIFSVIFRDGLPAQIVSFVQELCNFVNWINQHIIGTSPTTGVLCPIFNVLGNVLRDFANSLTSIPLFPSTIVNLLDTAGSVMLKILPCSENSLMECDFLDSMDDNTQETGALPVATRCSASYQSFFGDNTPLSCTRADTCHRGLLDTSLVACALCPTAAIGYQTFGCEPHTKMCTCQVQRLSETPCVRNSDCIAAPTCRYTDRFQQVAQGTQPCSTCAHERFCYVPDAQSSGFCACSLQAVQFSSCSNTNLGVVVHVQSDAMCLLTRDAQTDLARSTASFETLSSTPCNVVLPNSVFCLQIMDSRGDTSGYFAVAHEQIQGWGRRLLQFQEHNTTTKNTQSTKSTQLTRYSLNSRSSLCQDAATNTFGFLQHTHQACEDACLQSMETVQLLNLSIPALTFCSLDDFWSSIQANPIFPLALLADQKAMRVIISRHTHLRHLIAYIRSLQTALDAFAHDSSMSAYYQHQELNTNQTQHKHTRHLLQVLDTNTRTNRYDAMDALSFVFDSLFSDISKLHGSYASDLAVVTDTSFPALHDAEQDIWLSSWPPQYTTQQAQTECKPLMRLLKLSLQASNATLRHFTTYPPNRPSNKLADAWPTFENPNITAQSASNSKTVADWLSDTFKALISALLELVGLKQSNVRGWAYTLLEGLPDWVQCDIDRLQTCSGWRARLPNALIVSGAFFVMWYALLFQLNLGLVASLSMPLFGLLLLYTAYGYSLLCVPLIPPCFLLDLYQSLDALLPLYIDLPTQIYSNASCAHTNSVNASCLISCQNPPWEYDSWQDPLAWLLAELGVNFTDALFAILQYVPLFDTQPLRDTVNIKAAMHMQDDPNLLFVHRLCAFTSSYLLLPYVMLAGVLVFGGVAALVVTSRLLMPASMLVSSVVIAAFTE